MDGLVLFYATHPFWVWLAVAAIFLAVEVATGTGWLLWASGCAAVVAVIALLPFAPGLGIQVVIFAVLTIVTSLAARRLLPRRAQEGDDINDRGGRLVGMSGHAAGAFSRGLGRVLVDGAEWDAVTEADEIADGARVVVERVIGGARLSVRPA